MAASLRGENPHKQVTSNQSLSLMQDQVYAEDSPSGHKATYWEPGRWRVQVEYDMIPGPLHEKRLFNGQPAYFQSRKDMLTYENGRRLKARAHLPDDKKYVGFVRNPFDTSTMKKTMTFITKPFAWIATFFIRLFKGQEYYDQWILQKPENLYYPNYSAKNVHNFNIYPTPTKKLCLELGLKDGESHQLYTRSVWLKNSPLNGYSFVNKQNEIETITDAVSTDNDHSASTLIMAREVRDQAPSQESIFYTGRPDTEARACEQIAMIFSREMGKPEKFRKGITYNAEDNTYELTYLVTNLMTPVKKTDSFTSDEKKSIKQEADILEKLSGEIHTINGKRVRVKPLYFSQPFNRQNHTKHLQLDKHSDHRFSSKTNCRGYVSLNRQAESWLEKNTENQDRALLKKALNMLNNHLKELKPQEELFYRDLISKILKLPIVYHCKSSIDHTIIALAISVATHQWRKCGKDFSHNPHEILTTPLFKELFAMHMMSGHQVTRVSHSYEGIVNGSRGNGRSIGFDWGEGSVASTIATTLMPDRYISFHRLLTT